MPADHSRAVFGIAAEKGWKHGTMFVISLFLARALGQPRGQITGPIPWLTPAVNGRPSVLVGINPGGLGRSLSPDPA